MARDETPIRYPYEEVGVRKALTAAELRRFGGSGTASGRVAEPDNVKADLARARAQLYVRRPKAAPRWVLAHIERRAPMAEFVETLKKRTRRAPSAANQALALDLINEVARTSRGAGHITESLDQAAVDALTGNEKGEAR